MKKIIFAFIVIFLNWAPVAFCAGVISDGLYLTYHQGGLRLFENYTDLKREGILLQYFDSGDVEKIFLYHKNQQDGFSIGYYPDQKMQYRVHFKDGIKNGPAERFYPNGRLAIELTYRDGKPDGLARFYNEQGMLEKVALYFWGKLVRIGECDATGNIKHITE